MLGIIGYKSMVTYNIESFYLAEFARHIVLLHSFGDEAQRIAKSGTQENTTDLVS